MVNFEKLIIQYGDQYTDFAASTIAFMESQQKAINADEVTKNMPKEKRQFFKERLVHYRHIYRPQQ
ncbi:DNA polymerase III subunit theta [Brenneria rubrifaciens]|uniref:Surface composition regulator n=1 Tax=Brenneria rubrifaciens TaxID=55213 RepID=A0A4P8QTG8_9GAMM|nr:DNA polymerase III subunit theta [Brenneria rubrifaciens]QCR08700.1 DNA polymerase III subunit theta [Brenneria rubrifaciens]